MTQKTRSSLHPIALALAVAFSGGALATDTKWTSGATDAWETGTNWDTGSEPTNNDDVFIEGSGTQQPVISVTVTGEAKTVNIKGTNGDASLTITGGGLTVSNGISLASSANHVAGLMVGGTGNLTVSADGISLTGATAKTATLDFGSTGTPTADITGGVTLNDHSGLNVAGGTFTITDGGLKGSGTTTVSGGKLVITAGGIDLKSTGDSAASLTVNGAGKLTVSDGVVLEGVSSSKLATLDWNSSETTDSTIDGDVTLKDFSGLNITAGKLTISGAGKLTGSGTTTISGGELVVGTNGISLESTVNSEEKLLKIGENGKLTVNDGGIVLKGVDADHVAILESAGTTAVTSGNVTLDEHSALNVTGGTFGISAGDLTLKEKSTATIGNASFSVAGVIDIQQGGKLTLANDGDLSSSTANTRIDGTLDVSGISGDTASIRLADGSSSYAHTGTVVTKGKNLEIDLLADAGGPTTFNGLLGDGATNLTIQNTAATTATLSLGKAQTYTGETIVDATNASQNGDVKLKLDVVDAIKASSGVSLKSTATHKAILELGGANTIQGLSSSDEYSEVVLGANNLTIDTAEGKESGYYGKLTSPNSGTLTKSGRGVLKLAGDNSQFTGRLDISTGSVRVVGKNVSGLAGTDAGKLGAAVNVAGGATLEMFGDAHIDNAVTLSPSMTPGLIVYTEGNGNQEHAYIGQVNAVKDATVLFVIDDLANYTVTANNPVLGSGTFQGDDGTRFGAILTGNTDKSALVKDLYLINGTVSGLTNGADVTIWDGLVQYGAKMGNDGKVISTSVTTQSSGQAKAVSEGYLGSIGLLNMGSDLLQEKGVANAVGRVGGRSAGEAFAALGGGSLKHKTGSHVDISGFSLVTGLAAGVGSGATVGGFIEYGDGDYDSHNGFNGFFGSGKVKGSGDVDYLGVGLLGRFDLPKTASGQPYLEATARFGRANNEFKAKDFGYGMRGAKYDVKSDYYGLSFGGGHVWNLDAGSTVDLYGRYVWTHQEGDSTRLTWTGASGNAEEARVRFSDVDSHRVRVGTRYSRAWDGENRFYTGVAWEHEFDGKATAGDAARNVKIDDAPNLKGGTGIVEFGLVLYPSANKNLSIDLGVQGYGGKRQGATGSAQLKYAF
jgi:autotransporter-associated beta strand protein